MEIILENNGEVTQQGTHMEHNTAEITDKLAPVDKKCNNYKDSVEW